MLSDARFKFALESLKKCMLMEPKQNIFFSPHLIYHDLLMVYFGASDDIEKSLKKVLYIPDNISRDTLQQNYVSTENNQFCYIMKGPSDSFECRISSKLWLSNSKSLKPETSSLFSSAHQTMKSSDFKSVPDLARRFINFSISNTTERTISDLLPPDYIDSNTNIVMTSAIYLKGLFHNGFEDCELNTPDDCSKYDKKLKFVNKPSSSSGRKMRNDKEYMFNSFIEKLEQLGLKSKVYVYNVSLKRNEISIFFLDTKLFQFNPERDAGSAEIEKDKIIQLMELLTTEVVSSYLRNILEMGLPYQNMLFTQLQIKQNLPINKLLQMLSVPELMSSGQIELPAFSDDVTLGNALHQVSIEMTKDNIKAAASNAFFDINSMQHVQTTDIPVDIDFPSICLIYDKRHHNLLFCGILWDRKDLPVDEK